MHKRHYQQQKLSCITSNFFAKIDSEVKRKNCLPLISLAFSISSSPLPQWDDSIHLWAATKTTWAYLKRPICIGFKYRPDDGMVKGQQLTMLAWLFDQHGL